MQKTGKIYIIKNCINDKVYIGQTIQSLKKRFIGHCCYSKNDRSINMYIKRAIHKYGKQNFNISLLEECPIENLNEREKYWIAFYDSYNKGYNLTLGGQQSNYFNIHKLDNLIDIQKFTDYIIEFRPLATEVAQHFGISKCSVYNLIKRLNDKRLVLQSYNPRRPKLLDIDKIIKLYNSKWSILDISKEMKVRKDRISRCLKEQGITPRKWNGNYKHRI